MEKQISSRKFKTTVISMCLGFFMVVGAVIGVWAATTQNYKAGFNVSYSVGDNVAAKVRTEYFIPNLDSDGDGYQDGAVTVTTNEAGDTVTAEDGYVHFGAGEDSSEKSVEIGNLKLSPQTPKVYFYFTICSELENGYIQVILGEDYQQQNISVKTNYYNTASFTSSSSASTVSNDAYANKQYDNVSGRGVKIIRVEIAVKDTNKPATIEGDLSLGLYYSEKEQNVSTLSKVKLNAFARDSSSLTLDYAQKGNYKTTGIDLSETGDGSIWGYIGSDSGYYVISQDTIALPPDSSSVFSFYYWNPEYDEDAGFWLEELTLNNIDTSSVTNMSRMFAVQYDSYLENLDLSKFDTSSVTDMSYMFSGCSNLQSLDVTGFDTSSVTDMTGMFIDCFNLQSLDVSGFDTSKVTKMGYTEYTKYSQVSYGMFSGCYYLQSLDVSGFDTSSVTDMSGMFSGCNYLQSLDVSGFDTSSVTNMKEMFSGCFYLQSLDVAGFDTSSVTDMSGMFRSCSRLQSLDVSGFDTSQVTKMGFSDTYSYFYGNGMFQDCRSLTSLDVSGFDTSNVTDMSYMFNYCSRLQSLDVSGFDTSNVTNMSHMFHCCSSLQSLDVSGFDTSNVTNMSYMFGTCIRLTSLDLSNFDTSSVTDMSSMFATTGTAYSDMQLKTIYVSELWSTAKVTSSTKMFDRCTSLKGAVAYNSSKIDKSMANYTTGYLTYKAN
ncbi:MAG: BspA family leucine-rich repeat surface protein [Clostridiales bacterium]|nr:BspA family leucine-rich repeat surface protein [Clostridiales bacterium]